MFFEIDPRDTTYAFTEVNSSSTTNSIQRLSLANLQHQSAKPGVGRPKTCVEAELSASHVIRGGPPGVPRGFGSDPAYRWGWVTPIVFSAVTPNVVYSAANVLFKSTDRGGSWKPISPDLTKRINRDTIYIMGKAVGTVNYSPGAGTTSNPLMTPLFGTITFIAESPLNGQVLYTGTDDGQISVTRDGGASWTNVTPKIPGLPPFTFTSSVAASRFVPGRVYATFDGHFNHDDGTYVYVSEDFGQSWKLIIDGLPKTSVSRIAEDPRDAHVLVVGHARGVHFSNDGGEHWQSLNTNMPTVPIRSIVFQPRDNSLIAGTYARGVWILDDVGPLQKLTPDAVKNEALLVSITRGRQWELQSLGPTSGEGLLYLPNPEFNPTISYFVRDGAQGNAIITISDALGAKIRTLSGSANRGLNRVVWDMHMDAATPARGGGRGGGGGGGRGNAGGDGGGPLVLAGKYTVAITVPGTAATLKGTVTVETDPLDSKFSAHDRQVRQDAMMQLYSLQKELVRDGAAAQALEGEQDAIKRDLTANGAGGATARADSLNVRVQHIAAEIDRVIGVAGTITRALESFNSVPTADQRSQMAWVFDDAVRAVTMLNHASQAEIPSLYAEFAKGTKPRIVSAVPVPVVPVAHP